MSAAAYRTIADGNYTVEKMVGNYLELFEKIAGQPASRPRGPLVPPPELRDKVRPSIMLRYRAGRLLRRLKKIA
jgi:hypothetical protein